VNQNDFQTKKVEEKILEALGSGELGSPISEVGGAKIKESTLVITTKNGGKAIHLEIHELIGFVLSLSWAYTAGDFNSEYKAILGGVLALINVGVLVNDASQLDTEHSRILKYLSQNRNGGTVPVIAEALELSENLVRNKCEELWIWKLIREEVDERYISNDIVFSLPF